MQNYSATFVAVIVSLLGWFNLSHYVASSEVSAIVDAVLQLGGLVWVIVQRIKGGDVTPLGFRKRDSLGNATSSRGTFI